jgi:hypothetical protein
MARPNKGLDHVNGLWGDPQPKQRLQSILSTLGGQQSVDDACSDLGIGPTHFAALRRRVLQAGLDALLPRPVGRPAHVPSRSEREVAALRQRIAELEYENTILHARLELTALPRMPETWRPKSAGRSVAQDR